jgi:AcrR family transcriptional regulator
MRNAMQDDKTDRRVERTRQSLQQALAQLIEEKGYDAVTVQDITDRANVGRTTFYLHFRGKDDLFLSAHIQGMIDFRFGIFSKEELLRDDPPATLATIFKYLKENRSVFNTMRHGKDAAVILRAIQDVVARNLEDSLRASFSESDSSIPFMVLANYIAASQISFMSWWVERHVRYTPQEMAQIFHRLQRAAIRDALGIKV